MPRQTLIGFIVALLTVVAMSAVTYRVLQTRSAGVQTVMQSLEMTRSLEEAISTLKDAETGHRGYLLLGAEPYLGPYTAALDELPRNIEDIRRLAADSPAQLQRLDAVQHLAADRMALLREGVALKRAGQSEAALELVRSGQGMRMMTRLRALINEMQVAERATLVVNTQEWERAAAFSTFVTWTGAALLFFLIAAAAVVSSKDFREMHTQAWLRSGQNELSVRLQGAQELDQLGETIVSFIARYLNAQVGAIYFAEADSQLRLVGA